MQKLILFIYSQGKAAIFIQAALPVCSYLPVSITASQRQREAA